MFLIFSFPEQGHFRIGSENGEIYINQSLDWETSILYNLEVKAEDHGIPVKTGYV